MEIAVRERCIRCSRCVKVCPSEIFRQEEPGGPAAVRHIENCIVCGHCVAACPADAVAHTAFPPEKVHPVDAAALPTPAQVELLMASRRSNRAFAAKPLDGALLDRIAAAANRAPTATNAQELEYVWVTDPEVLRRISASTIATLGRLVRRLSTPPVRWWVRRFMPKEYGYLPLFRKLKSDFEAGNDRILKGASALLVIHAPRRNRFAAEDANLAAQNASLMAESLGVSQVYMGFILTALRLDRSHTIEKMLGLGGRRIAAAMAFGIPQFRYPNYIDRREAGVRKV